MRIIIAPAKKMVLDTDSFPVEGLPAFLERTERLKTALQGMSPKELQALWKCSDAIAKLNAERLAHMDLRRRLTPAILAYEGIQYRYMAPGVMEAAQLDYLREHLRILSGFYGLLRPFDGVTPYRLEMQAKLPADGFRDLYEFWGGSLAQKLAGETGLVLNLASKEYSKCAQKYITKEDLFVTVEFGELEEGKLRQKGTLAKMARGEMVRFLAENQVSDWREMRDFNQLGFSYSEELSDLREMPRGEIRCVFVKR